MGWRRSTGILVVCVCNKNNSTERDRVASLDVGVVNRELVLSHAEGFSK